MKAYLEDTMRYTREETLPEGMVLATQFLCIRKSDNRLVGMIQVRHYLNDFLRTFGGHIGYSVRPSERRKRLCLLDAEKCAAVLTKASAFPKFWSAAWIPTREAAERS